jgi:glycerophosphoryl diester phosphodiesterase
MIGDCQCLVDNQLYNNDKPYENRIAQKRVQLIKSGLTPQKAREVIEPDLIQAMLDGQNKHYSVIDGFPICENNIKIVSTVNSHQIVLASDGYPFLKNTLKESESLLEQQLKNDPQNIRTFIATKGLMPGNKSFDDRSYIRFFI